jgi:hypothetical protein
MEKTGFNWEWVFSNYKQLGVKNNIHKKKILRGDFAWNNETNLIFDVC